MRVIFIEDEETCVKIDLIEPRGHPLLASAERISPSPRHLALTLFLKIQQTPALLFLHVEFLNFSSHLNWKFLSLLPILIIQFSIFILPVMQGRRIGSTTRMEGRFVCGRESFFTKFLRTIGWKYSLELDELITVVEINASEYYLLIFFIPMPLYLKVSI